MKRGGGFVPAWRNIPKSHSSSILEVESASSIGSWTNSSHTMGNGKIRFVGVVMQGKLYQSCSLLFGKVHREIIRKGKSNFEEHNSFTKNNYKIYQGDYKKNLLEYFFDHVALACLLCIDLTDKMKLFFLFFLTTQYSAISQKYPPKHKS